MRAPFDSCAGDRRVVVSTTTPPPRTLSAWLAFIRDALATRRQRRALMALDDRTLSDIGLSRSQAYQEASRSLFDLPRQ